MKAPNLSPSATEHAMQITYAKTTRNVNRILLLCFAIVGVFAVSVSAQVSNDSNQVSGTINSNAILTLSNLTIPAGNKALVVVAIRNSNSLSPTTVTYNAQSLTLLQTSSSGTSRHHIYYRVLGDLAAPVTANVVITMSSAPVIQSAFGFSLKNVNQTTPLTNVGSVVFGGTATSSSTTVAGNNGDMALDFIGGAGNSSGLAPTFVTNSSGQTEIATMTGVNGNGFGVRFSMSRKTQTISPATMAWTIGFAANSTGQGIQTVVNVQSANKFYSTTANGNWNSAATWVNGTIPPATIMAGETIQILHTVSQNVNYTLPGGGTIEIGAAGNLMVATGMTLTNNGDLKNAGALTNDGTVSDAGTTTFNGAASQTVDGSAAPSFNKLVINNAAGVTFNTSAEVGDSLTLTSGNITMAGTNTLIIGTLGTISRTSGHVIGTLKKEFAGIGSFAFPVGTATGYTPVTAVVDTLGGGDFSVMSNDGFLINTDRQQSISRNWTLEGNGLNHADVTVTYLDADVPAGANESGFQFIRRSGTVNTAFAPTTFDTTTNTCSLAGITSFSKWALGNLINPTAAPAKVAGRVTKPDGAGLSKALVTMTDMFGRTRTAITNPFGYFHFDEVGTGQQYVVQVTSKAYLFNPEFIFVTNDITNLNLAAFAQSRGSSDGSLTVLPR